MNNNNILSKTDELLKEFDEQRTSLKKMIDDLEKLKEKIDVLFPNSIEKRYIMFFQEKIKTVSELYRVILDMRKEIIKSTKDEIEIRTKTTSDDDGSWELLDIRKIATRIENLKNDKKKIEQKGELFLDQHEDVDLKNVDIMKEEINIQGE